MRKNGYTLPEMLVVIVVLGVFTLGMLLSTSYAYKDNSKALYEQKESLIIHQAELYAEHLEQLKDEGNLVVTLNDLIDAGYYIPDDSNGNVTDPRNSKNTLNGLKIKLSYSENTGYDAKVIEDD